MLATAFQGDAGPCIQNQMGSGLEVDLLTRLNDQRLPHSGMATASYL